MEKLIGDCCCTAQTLTDQNESLLPVLADLAETQFFKYFKVQMDAECPFWAMEALCGLGGGCEVCTCDNDELPPTVLAMDALDKGADFV